MRMKRLVFPLAAALAVGFMVRAGWSEEKTPAPPAGMDAAMMAEMMKAMAPGPQHAALKKMVGKFTAEVSMKMTADGPDITSKGTETNEMILGDRYLKSDYTGDMMGQVFHGLNIVGYDNQKKKYVSIWLDDMSTGPMLAEGTSAADGKASNYAGEMICPANGQMMAFRQIVTITDDDHYQFEMFSKDPKEPAGKEFRGMIIKYTRVK